MTPMAMADQARIDSDDVITKDIQGVEESFFIEHCS